MLIQTLIKLFKRDLNALKQEVINYNDETNLWLTPKDISNSAGNLCLHLIGNLNHFIGTILGKTDYERQRNLEFLLKDVPREDILTQIDETLVVIENTLNTLTITDLEANYPLEVFKEKMTTEFFLVHLTTHLAYHLGQINYHRRLVDTTL